MRTCVASHVDCHPVARWSCFLWGEERTIFWGKDDFPEYHSIWKSGLEGNANEFSLKFLWGKPTTQTPPNRPRWGAMWMMAGQDSGKKVIIDFFPLFCGIYSFHVYCQRDLCHVWPYDGWGWDWTAAVWGQRRGAKRQMSHDDDAETTCMPHLWFNQECPPKDSHLDAALNKASETSSGNLV